MSDPNKLLDLMLGDMDQADPLYRPTNFWQSCLASIVSDLRDRGFENFREHRSAGMFYVPRHSKPVWHKASWGLAPMLKLLDLRRSRPGTRVRRLLDGEKAAHDEYRLFRLGDSEGGLDLDVAESSIGGGERFELEGKLYGKSWLNYLRGLTYLKRLTDTADLRSILEIGGGYGTAGEILLKARADAFYVNVDIPPLAAVSTYYLQQVFGQAAVLDYRESRSLETIDLDELREHQRAVVLCPWQLPRVRGMVDTFVNFMSFQEMEPKVVKNYVRLVQPLTRRSVLLRNSATGKPIAGKTGEVGVLEPITTEQMLALFDEFTLEGRDSLNFGDESFDRSFRSEVVCLERAG